MCAVLLTKTVGKAEEGPFADPFYKETFGTMFRSCFVLFTFIMEFQPQVCRQTWKEGLHGIILSTFFIFFTLFTHLALLEIVASVIVENIITDAKAKHQELDKLHSEQFHVQQLRELMLLFIEADTDRSGFLDWHELNPCHPRVIKLLDKVNMSQNSARELFKLIDIEGNEHVSQDDWVHLLQRVQLPLQSKHILLLERRLVALDEDFDHMMDEERQKREYIMSRLTKLEHQLRWISFRIKKHEAL